MMNRIQTEKEELEALRRRGFAEKQIARFCRLHKTYGQDIMDQPALDIRRLEFARYLIATGKLTDY